MAMAASRGLKVVSLSVGGCERIRRGSLRIAFLGIDEVGDLEVQGEVGLEILRVNGIL